jgi:S-adenosyl-L-methionine hydrolase (adenosine-forming)
MEGKMLGATQPLVALLTDFGTHDPYVGVMKGVMISRCPNVRLIDITHEVRPQNIDQGAYLLRSAYRHFPPYTVFLAVVDPGVGTERRPVAIKTSHGIFVGPDNGIFRAVLEEVETWQALILWPTENMSSTFHGRDLFAPVAADLACGCTFQDVGTPTVDLVQSMPPRISLTSPTTLEGEVIHIDHFGNIVTSLGPFEWRDQTLRLLDSKSGDFVTLNAPGAEVNFGNHQIKSIGATYGSTQPGELLVLINSDKMLEIAVNRGSAAQITSAQFGDPVQIRFTPAE